MTREEWLKDRLEDAARYPQDHPDLKGRLEELAALSLDEVADRVAEDLAGGCQDRLLGDVRADWAELDPADVKERAVGRLLRLGASALVERGAAAIRRYYEDRAGYARPDTCQPEWTAAEFARMGEELGVVQEALGRVALGGPRDEPAEVCSRVGRVVLGVVYADLLRDREAVVDLWRRGDWQALYDRGEIGAEELREFTAGYQGNPNYPGWAGRPAGAEPDF